MTSMWMRYRSGADMDSLRGHLSEKNVSGIKVVIDDWRWRT
jgi:hypothetical protein